MLTPRASSAGGAFTIECPASDVLCHLKGTVNETSGFRYRLARPRQPPALANSCWSQIGIDPCGQNRAGAERFKNSAAHDPERLPSYQRPQGFYPASRCCQPGCPREASNTAYPFARLFILRDPSSKGASAPIELDHVSPCVSFDAHGRDQRYVRPTSAIPHIKDEHPYFARLPTRFSEFPPMRADERCGSRRSVRFSWLSRSSYPAFFFPVRRYRAPSLWRPCHRPGFTQLTLSSTRATKTVSPPYRVNAVAKTARDVFLWQGALLGHFAGLSTGVSPAGASSRLSFRPWQF